MGSLVNWLDVGQQQRDNLNFVIDDAAVSVDVFRRKPQSGAAGLTVETHTQEHIRTIAVRLDTYRSRSTDRVTDTPIGLTTDTDVRVDDLWRWTDVSNQARWYRVVSVTRTQSSSGAVLEEMKR